MMSPFKFLDAYTLEDRDIFFGRNSEIDEIYEKIYKSNLFVLYGSSGTGKTSLIQCGLGNQIPSTDWLPLFIRREQDIITSVQNQLQNIALTKLPNNSSNEEDLISNITSVYVDYFKPIYLIFDQFEELFISGNDAEKTYFFSFLKALLEADIQVKVILSIREEYLAQLTVMEKSIPALFENRMRIENMTPQKIVSVIKESCSSFNIPLEHKDIPENIYSTLVNKDGIVELPHLQVYLDRLYRSGSKDNAKLVFTDSLIKKIGSLDDVLATFLNEQVASLKDPTLGWQLLKFFITDRGTKKTVTSENWRNYLAQNFLAKKELKESKDKLIEQRVIRYRNKENAMELSHDSLALRVFENLSREERQLIEVKNFLNSSYQNYLVNGSLLNANDIPFIEPYIQKMPVSKAIKVYFYKSKQKAKSKKRIRFLIIIVVFTILLAITTYSGIQQQKAEKALENFAKERTKNIQIQVKQLFETIEVYQKAGYDDNAKTLLDSIHKINLELKDANIRKQLEAYE